MLEVAGSPLCKAPRVIGWHKAAAGYAGNLVPGVGATASRRLWREKLQFQPVVPHARDLLAICVGQRRPPAFRNWLGAMWQSGQQVEWEVKHR